MIVYKKAFKISYLMSALCIEARVFNGLCLSGRHRTVNVRNAQELVSNTTTRLSRLFKVECMICGTVTRK